MLKDWSCQSFVVVITFLFYNDTNNISITRDLFIIEHQLVPVFMKLNRDALIFIVLIEF